MARARKGPWLADRAPAVRPASYGPVATREAKRAEAKRRPKSAYQSNAVLCNCKSTGTHDKRTQGFGGARQKESKSKNLCRCEIFCPARPPLGVCGHVSGFRARSASRGRVASLFLYAASGRPSAGDALAASRVAPRDTPRAAPCSDSRGGKAHSTYAAPGRSMAAFAPMRYHLTRALTRARVIARLASQVYDATVLCSPRRLAGRASLRPRAGSGPVDERPRLTRCAYAGSFTSRPDRAFDESLRAAPAPGQNITRSL